MRASHFFISTLKEAPADAEIISHKLMVRAGMIRRLGSGIYAYMPMGLRVIQKIENIIREEMNKAGAIELLMPIVQPAELWQETGRWQKYGPELLRIKDRHDRDFIIQPTSEEVITDIARNVIKSYRQLPVNFYHIQTKFRDERRPRFGLMRGREFTMKDAYSFDRDVEGLKKSYQIMFNAYVNIFNRFGLKFRPVAADNGAIGGSVPMNSTSLPKLAKTLSSIQGNPIMPPIWKRLLPCLRYKSVPPRHHTMQKVPTPGQKACEDVTTFLKQPLAQSLKVIAAIRTEIPEGQPGHFAVILLRGDHELNEIKTQKNIGEFRVRQRKRNHSSSGMPVRLSRTGWPCKTARTWLFMPTTQ